MEQVMPARLCPPGCTRRPKSLPAPFPVPSSFRGKITKRHFNSSASLAGSPDPVFLLFTFPNPRSKTLLHPSPNVFIIWRGAGVRHSFLLSFPGNEYPILNPESKIKNPQFPNPWYTTRRAPLVSLGADVSGNCFDHYRSMPDGNQIGLFYCQAPRFRKEAPAASRQWDKFRGALPRGRSRGDSAGQGDGVVKTAF